MNKRITSITSKHFTWKELTDSRTADRLGIDNLPYLDETIDNLCNLSRCLSQIRDAFGKPILVNSGFRCYDLNKAVGGVPNSKHLIGKAADLRCLLTSRTYELYMFLEQAKFDFIDKIIWEQGFYPWIHLQIK